MQRTGQTTRNPAQRLLGLLLVAFALLCAPQTHSPVGSSVAYAQQATPSEKNRKGETVRDIMNNFSQVCLACGITARIFGASMQYGKAIFPILGEAVSKALAIIFVLWVLVHIIRLYAPFTPSGRVSNISGEVFNKAGLVLFMALILMSSQSYKLYWDYIYKPVVTVSINLSSALLDEGAKAQSVGGKYVVEAFTLKDGARCSATNISGLTAEEKELQLRLECQIHTLQNSFTYGLALGWWLLWNDGVLIGVVLLALSIMPILTFAVTVIDALMRWTMISVCMPALFGCYIFPSTRNFAVNGFKGLLESGLTLSIVAIVAVLTAGIMQEAVKEVERSLGIASSNISSTAQTVKNSVTPPATTTPTAPTTKAKTLSGTVTNTPLAATTTQQMNKTAATTSATPKTGGGCQGIIWPCDGRNNAGTTGRFGSTWNGPNTLRPFHAGLDIVCKIDEYQKTGQDSVLTSAPVWAAHAGTVTTVVSTDDSRAGKYVAIKEAGGISTRYLHLSETKVKQGDKVQQGQIIGIQGFTGGLTIENIHLHFEIYDKNDALIDPEVCLAGKTPPANGTAGATSGAQGVTKTMGFGDPETWLLIMASLFATHALKGAVGMGANLLNVQTLTGAGKAILGAGMGAAGFLTGIAGGAAANKIGEVAGAIPDALGNMGQAINNNPLAQGISQGMQDGIATMQGVAENLTSATMSRMGDMAQGAMNNPLMQGLATAANAVQGLADATMGRISEIQQNIAQGVASAAQGIQDVGGRITGALDAAGQGLQNAIPQGLRDASGFAAEKLGDAAAVGGRLAAAGATNLAVGTVNSVVSTTIGLGGAGITSAVNLAVEASGSGDFLRGVGAGAGLYQGRQFSEAEIARAAGLQQVILDNEAYIKSLRAQKEAIENANSPSYIADPTRRSATMDELDYRLLRARYESDQADTAKRDVAGHYDPKEGQNWGQRMSGQIGDRWDVVAHTHLRDVFYRANNPSNPRYINDGSARDIAAIGLAGYEERLYTFARQYERTVDSDTRSIRNSSDQKALDRAVEQYMKRNRDAIEAVSGGTMLRDVTSGAWQQSVAQNRSSSPAARIMENARNSIVETSNNIRSSLSNPNRGQEEDTPYIDDQQTQKKDYGEYESRSKPERSAPNNRNKERSRPDTSRSEEREKPSNTRTATLDPKPRGEPT